jgi:hypothetical protein
VTGCYQIDNGHEVRLPACCAQWIPLCLTVHHPDVSEACGLMQVSVRLTLAQAITLRAELDDRIKSAEQPDRGADQ